MGELKWLMILVGGWCVIDINNSSGLWLWCHEITNIIANKYIEQLNNL